MDAVNAITAECFNALNQLRVVDGPISSAELVHSRITGFVEAMREKARDAGYSQRDTDDMAYAVVALADEVALGKPEPLRSHWMAQPLQLRFFNENVAGENFFVRLEALRGDRRRVDVMKVYYLCLLFGFQGKYAIRGGEIELMRIIDHLRDEIERTGEPVDALAPHGEPPDEPAVRRGGLNPLVYLPLAIFAVALATFIGLRVKLDRAVDGVVERVESTRQ